MSEVRRVVLIGGHGKVALLAAPKLVERGFAVDSLIRNPDHSAEISATGANPVVLDIENAGAQQLAEAFKGAHAIVFSAGAGGGNKERTRAVDFDAAVRSMEAAKQAGVSRYVMVSYSRALVDVDRLDPDHSFYTYAKAKHDADAVLRESDLDYTILGPGALTLDPATKKITIADETGNIDGKAPEAENGKVSRENVAEVITHVVDTDAAQRSTVNFYDGSTAIAEAIS
ncbi:SDR family oxidoreductase [Glutamicibacter sp. JL.03c]|uniref:SDR family oxidoreductase n=1 Tax=Glutamicibacter sp. JL.03c TaxID=2984842 RepID=UPI0021F73BCB|nr:SDR family oxidoreductase [Glutamicibacter sp. JL.03c]UYQ77383.1 SDR family oxidoreductase [Glutamicibacter sp. JL.03c]